MTLCRYLLLVVVIALSAACQKPQRAHTTADADATATQKETEGNMKNEALIRQYFEHFNDHAWDKMAAMYAADAQFKDPSLGTDVVRQSHQEIVVKYSALAETFPDLKDTVVATYASGEEHFIVEFVSSGTAPDGTAFELPICTIFTIEDGLITKDFTYYDNFES